MNTNIEENLKESGIHVSTTAGYSMYPMLRNRRDRVIIRPVGEKKLRRYDLPLYKRPSGQYVLHRIVGVRKDHYLIRGDNTYVLEHVPFDWVLGYVTEFYREDRHVLSSSRWYRFYACMWHVFYPVRWFVHKAKSFARLVVRKIRGRK